MVSNHLLGRDAHPRNDTCSVAIGDPTITLGWLLELSPLETPIDILHLYCTGWFVSKDQLENTNH